MFFKKKNAEGKMRARISGDGAKKMIVGLGNPGAKYDNTRHNIGFAALDYIAKEEGVALKKIQFKSLLGVCNIAQQKTILLKPQTFMNLSGEAVCEAMRYYKLRPEDVLLLVDDAAIDTGQLRIKRKGSDGGQNGLKSIIYLSGSDMFPRIRIGIGKKPHPNYSLADWVLSRFDEGEIRLLKERLPDIYEASRLIIAGEIDEAMGKFSKNALKEKTDGEE